MSILKRVKRILSANVNDILEKAEDPEKMIKQMIRDMEDNVREARTEVAEAMAHFKKLEAKTKQQSQETEKWQKNAEIAVKKGNDALAKEALKKKNDCSSAAENFGGEAQKQKEAVETLQESLSKLEDKLDEMKKKKDILIAKTKSSEAAMAIHKRGSQSSKTDDAISTWERMVEKVEDRELTAEAHRELGKLNSHGKSGISVAELDVEFELEKLKEQMGAEKGA